MDPHPIERELQFARQRIIYMFLGGGKDIKTGQPMLASLGN
jgi:hypothetical protein